MQTVSSVRSKTSLPGAACVPWARCSHRHVVLPTSSATVRTRASRQRIVEVKAFQLDRAFEKMKDAMAQATDSTRDTRRVVLEQFYTKLSRSTAEELLAPNFEMYEVGHAKKFNKDDYIGLLYNTVLPSIPDFKWGFATDNRIDGDGYVLVTVTASGHHTGTPFALPGAPALPASGRHFCLAEEAQLVKVEGGKIREIKVFPAKGSGPRALYAALAEGSAATSQEVRVKEGEMPLP